jgi:preprotein translocase subunit SecB
MDLSPLQLKHYHFTEFSVVASTNVRPEDVETGGTPYPLFEDVEYDAEVLLGTFNHTEPDANLFVLQVKVFGAPTSASSKFPYTFSVCAEGVFEITHSGDISERKRIVVVNGAGVLYGAIREQLLSTTSRCSHGAMLLPTADFRSLREDDKSAPPQKPKKARASTVGNRKSTSKKKS